MHPSHDNAMSLAEADANGMATKLIALAEGLFGVMTSPWTFCGVIFQDQVPHLFYHPESTEVRISLSYRALGDLAQRDFQLAHEVSHLLYPSAEPTQTEPPQAIVLNEGIATLFSVIVVAAFHGREMQQGVIESLANNSPKYFTAFQLVSELLSNDEEAIKKIRAIQPMLNKVNEADLRASGLMLAEDEIGELVALF